MRKNKILSVLTVVSVAIISSLSVTNATQAHIIVNEIRPAGSETNEFIELFNPTDTEIDLTGYKIAKKTKSGSESLLLSASKFSGTIQAHGYFLIAHPSVKDAIFADLAYSGASYYISNDNTVLLYDENGIVVDTVGFGSASDFEESPAPNPNSDESLERKNFSDTENNADDFSVNSTPSPQNSNQSENVEEEPPIGNPEPDDDIMENDCLVSSPDIKLNEIFPRPESGDEFVEVKNAGDVCVDISGWKIMDSAGHQKEFPSGITIDPGEYAYLEENLYLNNDSDTVYLLEKNGNTENDAVDSRTYEKASKNLSYSLDENIWSWTSSLTPGKENVIISPEEETPGTNNPPAEENYTISDKIYLNEIFPNPENDSDEEYIELKNSGDEPADLYKWTLRDGSKNGKYAFEDHVIISPGGCFAVYKSQSKLSLNNSNESVSIFDPQDSLVSSISYEKSQKDASYSFDGANWKWSKYSTPGAENKFDSEPDVKIKKPKKVYKNIPAEFSAKATDKETKKMKYIWDFGDGDKSYLKKANHKFLKIGKYTVTLSVRDESQTVEKSFTVQVKDSPRPNLEIVKIVPNPSGKDEDGEIIGIKNNSKKKTNIEKWKIATGSGKKMYNHPISEDLVINPNETKTITRKFSKFSLANKSGKVALAMPDGKIIDKIEYSKEKIEEDEAYTKIDGGWQWIVPNGNATEELAPSPDETEFIDDPTGEIEAEENDENENATGEVLGANNGNISDNFFPARSAFSPEDAFAFFTRIGFLKSPEKEANYCPLKTATASLDYLLVSSI